MLTKTGDAAGHAGEKTLEVGKTMGKGALRLGGKAVGGLGSLAKKAGKKMEEAGEEKKE